MVFGLSTSWNAFRYSDAKAMVFEIKSLGFEEVELSFNLTSSMVVQIEGIVRDNAVRVVSVHNFCPIPDGMEREAALPDCYSLASLDEDARQMALKFTKRTIDTASRLGAQAVVLHTGRVDVPDKTRTLIEYYQNNLKSTQEFQRLRDQMLKERSQCVQPYFENTLKSLDELSRYAQKSKISLGVETRFYYREIPSFEELGIILDTFKDANVYYWHDTGHAQVMENLGFTKHEDFLQAYGQNMLGIHLHNVIGCDDHQAPVTGDFNFSLLKSYLRPQTLKIIEAHHPADAKSLKESKSFLEKLYYGKG